MDSQVFVTFKGGQDSVRNTSDSHLKRGSIFDQPGAPATDLQLGIGQLRGLMNSEWFVDGDCQIDLVLMDQTISMGPGHVGIDLCNDSGSVQHSRPRCVHRYTQ